MMMNRRSFSTALLAGAAASLISTRGMAANATPPKARNVVLVHGLFADGSCWSEVIARLQTSGLNVTSVQNPLTTLPEAVASAERVLARQDGPTVLVGHSFSGVIVTEAGVHSKVSALVYVAARAPDAGEDYTALAKAYPTPPRPAGSEGQGALCGPAAVPQGTAHRQDYERGLAIKAELLRRLDGRSHDQSGPRAIHGQAHGSQDHRG